MDSCETEVTSSSDRNRSCFIVEDELLIGMDLEDAIGAAGYEPHWFASQESALSAIALYPPHVAIVDVKLNDGFCTELVRELRRRNIPFIVHSASTAADATPDLNGVPWLTKPADPPAILRALLAARLSRTGAEQA